MQMISLICSTLCVGACQTPVVDARSLYDVDTYRMDLIVDPEAQTYSGTVVISAKVTTGKLDAFEFDLMQSRKVLGVALLPATVTPNSSIVGKKLTFTHQNDRVRCTLPQPIKKGDIVSVAVTFDGGASSSGQRGGIRFGKTPDGKPWITTSCQSLGAHSWWPCKGENEHPEDKFAHLFMNVTVPKGLTAVCNGKLTERTTARNGWETFHWRHDYPCENYAVTLDIAPYVEVNERLVLPEITAPVPFQYFVLPQDLEKAKTQFTEVQKLLEVYGEAFGPFPFPGSKFGLVQTDFWGMEHSTAVAYGNSFPTWLRQQRMSDERASRNLFFDYILIHEVAHEWWGNAVSAEDWGHLWIHEGFATYAEAVYMEKLYGAASAQIYLDTLKPRISPKFRMYRGDHVLPSQAFDNNVYYKGAWVLHTLRTYVNDDKAWWKALREFNMRFRYKNAKTEGFQSVLEEVTGKGWQEFFLEWFYGNSYPSLTGSVTFGNKKITIDIENPPQFGTGFHVPLDLTWSEDGKPHTTRVMLTPGSNKRAIDCESDPQNVRITSLSRILCDTKVVVEPAKNSN